MKFRFFDRVKETGSVTGTGPVGLAGAAPGFMSFSQAGLADAGTTTYSTIILITDATGLLWEVCYAEYASGTLTRSTVIASSYEFPPNVYAPVNFPPSSSVTVTITNPAKSAVLVPSAGSVAIGTRALADNEPSFLTDNNTAIGYEALYPGYASYSTAIGAGALSGRVTGPITSNNMAYYCTAVGYNALRFDPSTGRGNGQFNVAIGYEAGGGGDFNSTGFTFGRNVAIGATALYSAVGAFNNVAIGAGAMYSAVSNNTCIAIGKDAMGQAPSASNMIAIGRAALNKIADTPQQLSGSNVAIGHGAMEVLNYPSLIVSYCTAIGDQSQQETQATGSANNTSVGARSLQRSSGVNNTVVGASAASFSLMGLGNNLVAVGAYSMLNHNITDSVGVGYGALNANGGSDNVAVGTNSMQTSFNPGVLTPLSTSVMSVAVGSRTLRNVTTGDRNIAIGCDAMVNTSTGSDNISIGGRTSAGYNPVFDVTTESNRIALGSTSATHAYVNVAWTIVSDERDKTAFAPAPYGLDFVKQLQPVAYRRKEDRSSDTATGPVRLGFKAQHILALEGSAPIIIDAEDPDRLRYSEAAMVATLVKALQELNQKFEDYVAAHP